MSSLVLFVVVVVPLAALVAMTTVAYLDADRVGMNPRKWAAIVFFVPLFGFFLYLFERSERDYDPESDPYREGGYNFYEPPDDDRNE